MDALKIGNSDCTVKNIVQAMEKSPVFSVLQTEWRELARVLGTPFQTLETTRKKLRFDDMEISEAITVLLEDWQKRQPMDATLYKLIQKFEQIGCREFSNLLKKQFESSLMKPRVRDGSPKPRKRLVINADKMPKDVLDMIQLDIVASMGSEIVNQEIFLELHSYSVLDKIELQELLNYECRLEQDRILRLMELLSSKDNNKKATFLEILCNSPELPTISKSIPNILRKNNVTFQHV